MDAPTGDDDGSETASATTFWDDVGYITRITQARMARGMSLTELCKRTGRSPAYFRARPGKSRQTGEIFMVAEVLEVSPGYLMGLEGYRDPREIRRLRDFSDISAHLFCAFARAERDIKPDEIIALFEALLKEGGTFKRQGQPQDHLPPQ
jgi:transcriptional regulator with XRE-family HTH domain